MTDPADRLYERVQVVRAQAGDAAAFADLVGRYHARLRYYLGKLAQPQAADDILQDVWLDVWQSLPRLRDAAAFPAWLYRVARDRAVRTFRLPPPPLSLDTAELAAGPNGVADEFTAEDAARVHAALDALAREFREVLVLRFLEEMRYDAIARVVGCPVGTVRSRLHHAKRALRRELERTMTRE
jgi:RNA polymerase sigma-70 factor, ECF subfamily